MSVWQTVLIAWFGGAFLLAVLVGKMIAFGNRPSTPVVAEPAVALRRPLAAKDSVLAG